MIIIGSEAVDDSRYHLITDKGIFLLDINLGYNLHGVEIPTFESVEHALISLNS